MSVASDTRTEITAALLAADLPAFSSPQPTTPVPSVTVNPDTPYLEPTTLGAWSVYLRLVIMVQAFDPSASLAIVEDLAERTVKALPPGVLVREITAPQLISLGEAQGKAYQADVAITANAK